MAGGHRDVHYFVAATEDRRVVGHAWRLWSHGTSFYVSARDPELGAVKFSLHGPDPRPGLTPTFRLAAVRGGNRAGLRVDGGALPLEFPGKPVGVAGVRHVLKFRFPYDVFDGTLLSGIGASKPIKSDARGIVVGAPASSAETADLDLYVSEGDPYLPANALADGAVLGPIHNDAGQSLTGVSRRFPVLRAPTPASATSRAPAAGGPSVRGVWMGLGGYGFAWVVETRVSREWFFDRSSLLPSHRYAPPIVDQCALQPPWGWGNHIPAPTAAAWRPVR